MGRIQSTATLLILASTLPAMHFAVAAENPADSDGSLPTVSDGLPVAVTDAALLSEEAIRRLLRLYREARADGMTDEAEVLAKQIVQLSITMFGVRSKRTAEALTDLGRLQASTGNYNAAILNLAQAIEIIESLDDYLSEELLHPVSALADVQMRAGAADLAASNWTRAVHISHVNFGPHNYQQIESLVSLGRLYASVGETKAATKIRRRIEYLQAREAAAAGEVVPEDLTATRLTVEE